MPKGRKKIINNCNNKPYRKQTIPKAKNNNVG